MPLFYSAKVSSIVVDRSILCGKESGALAAQATGMLALVISGNSLIDIDTANAYSYRLSSHFITAPPTSPSVQCTEHW